MAGLHVLWETLRNPKAVELYQQAVSGEEGKPLASCLLLAGSLAKAQPHPSRLGLLSASTRAPC